MKRTHFISQFLCVRNMAMAKLSWPSLSILKEINPEYSLEGLLLKLKLQYFGHLMRKAWFIGKDPDAEKDWRREEKGTTEDEMIGWHHLHNGHEFEQAPRVGEGQGSVACCSPWGLKELNKTEWLNWTQLHCRQILYQLSHQGSPIACHWHLPCTKRK